MTDDVGTSTDHETTIGRYTGLLHGWENLRETTDVDERGGEKERGHKAVEGHRVTPGGIPDFAFSHGVPLKEWDATGVFSDGKDGPAHEVGDLLESEELKEREEQHLQGEVVHHWAPSAPHNSKEHDMRGDEDDGEQTWYFTWS